MVEAAGEGGRGRRPAQGEVPLKEVVLEGLGVVVGGGVRGELGGLFDWSLVSGVAEGTRDGRIRRMVGFLELNCPTVVISAAKGVGWARKRMLSFGGDRNGRGWCTVELDVWIAYSVIE